MGTSSPTSPVDTGTNLPMYVIEEFLMGRRGLFDTKDLQDLVHFHGREW